MPEASAVLRYMIPVVVFILFMWLFLEVDDD